MRYTMLLGILGWLALTLASPVIAQPFTYQGVLKQNGQPVNGTLSMSFKLFTALTGGAQVGSTITQTVNVQNGLFTVPLDFGTVWDGSDRYLEISVGSTVLSPRVKINPAPYASTAFFAQRPWQTIGTTIFYNGGRVGIGTNTPAALLSLDNSVGNKISLWGQAPAAHYGLGVQPGLLQIYTDQFSSDIAFGYGSSTNFTEWVRIKGNGNVGIGTSNPSAKLHIVNGHLRVDNGEIQSWGWLTLHPDVDNTGDDVVRFVNSAGNETMRVDDDGNVGINTMNPWYRLHVEGDGYFTGRLMVGDDGNAGQLYVSSSGPYTIYAVNQGTGSSGGIAIAGTATATSGNFWGVFGESQSTTGIGVRGQAIAESGTNTGVWGVSRSSSGRGVYGEAVSPNGTTYGVFGVSLSPSGRGVFGWGYATTGTNFGVYGESRSPDGRAVYGLASATSGWNFGVAGESRSPDGLGGWFGSAGKKGARIVGQGSVFYEDWPSNWQGGLETWDIVCAAIRYNWIESRSDARLKRDIQPVNPTQEFQRLLSLRPVSYYWRDERLPQTQQYGFIAQELREVFPELVSEGEDPQKTLAVNYQALIPLLVNALQVQQEQIRQQEARIQRLEAELQRLRASAPNK